MKKDNRRIMAVFFLLLTTGCSATPVSVIPSASFTLTPTRQIATITPTSSSSEEPWTGTPTALFTPTTLLTTNTPQPTLSAENAKTFVFDLLKDNGECNLPCLWGLTPGKTDIQTLDGFISQFGELETPDVYIHISDFRKMGGFFITHRENNVHITLDFSYYKGGDTGLEILALYGYAMYERGKDLDWMSPDVRQLYGDASFNKAFEYYMLPQILSNYGQPSQVLLAPFPDDPDRPDIKWQPFSLVLLYPEQGIFVEYVSPREIIGSDFVGCTTKSHLSLAVWSPDYNLPLKYIVQKAGLEINELNIDYLKPVEEATSISLDKFYQVFKNPKNTSCIKTPIELWVEP